MVLFVIQSDELTTLYPAPIAGPGIAGTTPPVGAIPPVLEDTPDGLGMTVAPEELEKVVGKETGLFGGVVLNGFEDMINWCFNIPKTRYQVRISTYYK
jgi:hypothetical protein